MGVLVDSNKQSVQNLNLKLSSQANDMADFNSKINNVTKVTLSLNNQDMVENVDLGIQQEKYNSLNNKLNLVEAEKRFLNMKVRSIAVKEG